MAIQKNTTNLLKKLGLPYTPLINSTMDLIKNPASLGVYVYLQSKPENWVIREKDLMTRFGKGRDFVRARLKDLRDAGLLVSKSSRDKGGKIISWTTILYSHIESQIQSKEESEIEDEADFESEQKQPEDTYIEPEQPDNQDTVETTLLVNPTHIKERDLSLVKKETTTTVVDVFVSETLDKELLDLRNEHMPTDARKPEEFIKQCKWHLDKGDTKKYNFSQRMAGLKKLIRQKRFETPGGYPAPKKAVSVSDDVIMNQYKNYYHSWVEQDLRSKGHQTLSFDQWRKRA
jgi:hypothetical protein